MVFCLLLNDNIMKNIKNILIRDLTDQDRAMINRVMQETGCFQASKAVMKAGYAFERNQNMIKIQSDKIKSLEAELFLYRKNAKIVSECLRKMENMLSKSTDDR